MIGIILAWICYFFIHSFLAHQKVKQYFYTKFPSIKKYYRIVYNIVAIIGICILIPYSILGCHQFIFQPNTITNIVASIFITTGLIIMFKAFQLFNLKEFFGFEQLQSPEKSNDLIIKGLYQYVRHPLYTGLILFIIGIWLLYPTLAVSAFAIISFAYIDYGSSLEENKLILEFGNQYKQYQQSVKKLIPFIY